MISSSTYNSKIHSTFLHCFTGGKYAILAIKVALMKIMKNYRLDADYTMDDIKLRLEIVLRSASGYKIKMYSRRDNRNSNLMGYCSTWINNHQKKKYGPKYGEILHYKFLVKSLQYLALIDHNKKNKFITNKIFIILPHNLSLQDLQFLDYLQLKFWIKAVNKCNKRNHWASHVFKAGL